MPEEIWMFESAVTKVEIRVESPKRTLRGRGIYPRFRLEVRGVPYYVAGKALNTIWASSTAAPEVIWPSISLRRSVYSIEDM